MWILDKIIKPVMGFFSSRLLYITITVFVLIIVYMVTAQILYQNFYFNPNEKTKKSDLQERSVKLNIVYLGEDVKSDLKFNKALSDALEKKLDEFKLESYKGTVFVLDYFTSNGFWYIFDIMLATKEGENNDYTTTLYPSKTIRLFFLRSETGEYDVARKDDTEKIYAMLRTLTASAQDHGFSDIKLKDDNNLIMIKKLLDLKVVESIANLQNPNVKGESDSSYVLPFYKESGEWVVSNGIPAKEYSLTFSPVVFQNAEIASPTNGYVDLICEDPTYTQAYVKIVDSKGREVVVSQLKTGTINVKLGQEVKEGQLLGEMNADNGDALYGSDGCYIQYSTAVGANNFEVAQWVCKESVVGRPCGRQSGSGVKVIFDKEVTNFDSYKLDSSTVLADTKKTSYDPLNFAYKSKLTSQNLLEKAKFNFITYPAALQNPPQFDKISGLESTFEVTKNDLKFSPLKRINLRFIRSSNGTLIREQVFCQNKLECDNVGKFNLSIPSYAGGIILLIDREYEDGKVEIGSTMVPYSRYIFR